MTSTPRPLRSFAAVLVAATFALTSAGTVLAEDPGDVYVANAGGVDEVLFSNPTVTAITADRPTSLAFAPDGRTLYLLEGTRTIAALDIERRSIGTQWPLAEDAAAIAFPKGTSLLVAYPGSAELGVLVDGADALKPGWALDFKPTMLAGDSRETAALAAATGGTTVAIVDTALGTVTSVAPGGKVAAIAVGRDEGVGYVATTSPNQLVTFELATRRIVATAKLPGEPTAVAAVVEAAVVSVGDTLVKVAGKDSGTLKVTSGEVLALVAGNSGRLVYAAVGKQLLAIKVADAGSSPKAATLTTDAPTAIVATPYATEFEKAGTSGTGDGTSGDGGTDQGGTKPGASPSKPPATDTVPGGDHFHPAGADPLTTLLAATGVATLVAVGLWAAVRKRLPKS